MVIFKDSAKQWSQYSEEQRLPVNALKNASSFKMGKFKKWVSVPLKMNLIISKQMNPPTSKWYN